jgi:hypothetical protein
MRGRERVSWAPPADPTSADTLGQMSPGHIIVTVLGGCAEVLGLYLVLREARPLRREELGHISILRQLWEGVKDTIRNPAPVMLEASGASSTSATGTLTVTTIRDENAIDEIRRRVTELEAGLVRTNEHFSSETEDIRARVDEVAADANNRIRGIESKRKADLAQAIRNENRGVCVFLIGAALNMAANLVA